MAFDMAAVSTIAGTRTNEPNVSAERIEQVLLDIRKELRLEHEFDRLCRDQVKRAA